MYGHTTRLRVSVAFSLIIYINFYAIFSAKLGIIIVKKRGNARFFARDPRNARQFINPPPGTVIDHTITNQGMPLKCSIIIELGNWMF